MDVKVNFPVSVEVECSDLESPCHVTHETKGNRDPHETVRSERNEDFRRVGLPI